ncbi:MAG: MBL fold metallo-hydrolase [Cytophagales bacterium]|nr:MBL fold metallo-hydrolase [Cytophagales bacterium]
MAKQPLFTATYIGGPTAILEIGGLRFLTDPTLDPGGSVYHLGQLTVEKTESPATFAIGSIDIVLLSHDQHFDNLDNGGRLLLQKAPRTYTTVDGAARLQGTSRGLSPWQSETVVAPDSTEIQITATPARHGPAGTEKIQGEVIGFLLSVGREAAVHIYLTGDTVYYEGVAEVARRYHPRYVFIFAGAAQTRGPFNVTMGTNDAMDTALAFPNAIIIPLHYRGWKHYTQNEEDLKRAYQVIGVDGRLQVLEPAAATPLAW